MEDVEKIELRSEKVRHLIGEIPPGIVRYGILIITLIVAGLMAGAYFIPYPESVGGEAVVLDSSHIEVSVPYKYVNTLKNGMKVSVEFEGYDTERYGYVEAVLIAMNKKLVSCRDENYFVAILRIKSRPYQMEKGMKGRATIFIADESILERIVYGTDGLSG